MRKGSSAAPAGAGAVLAAAGVGERMGLEPDRFKALLDLCGRPMAAHSLAVMQECPDLEAVVVVAPPGCSKLFERELVEPWNFGKVVSVVDGGSTRQESVRKGLEALDAVFDPVAIHDAARPLVGLELLSACIKRGAAAGACVPGVRVSSTMKIVGPGGLVKCTLDRRSLREIQTPQVFSASIIRKAHGAASADGVDATDDAALVERLGVPVTVIEGSAENIKITRPLDMAVAAAIMSRGRGGGPC